jgi:hypothetical protein
VSFSPLRLLPILALVWPAVGHAQSDTPEIKRRPKPVSAGAFGGLGFPRPLTVEGMVRIDDVVGLGVEYSVLPTLTISGVETTFWALAGDARVFPFRNAFFIGVAAGHQRLGAHASSAVTGPMAVTATTWFINPRIGVLVSKGLPGDTGLTLGIDAGVQIPVSASLEDDVRFPHPAVDDARDVARFFGKRVLPTVDLVRLGFMF